MHIAHYKMCLFDVDKTLSNSRREITPRTQKALHTLMERGIRIGICSGRHFATLKSFVFPYFPKESLHIVSEGAQIIQTDGTVVWEKLLRESTVKKIIEAALQQDMIVVLQKFDTLYTNSSSIPKEERHVTRRGLKDVTDFEIPVLVVYGVNEAFMRFLSSIPDISFRKMLGYDNQPYVDIMSKGIHKGTAVGKLARLAGIGSQDIVGFGDSVNDIEFLQSVGYAVAMGNATSDVKAIAHEVIGKNDEDGLAVFIENALRGN